MVKEIEIHLRGDSDFSREGWARKVKSLGGRYTSCRGYSSKRFVTLPFSETGLALLSELHRRFGRSNGTTWIARPANGPAWVSVRDVSATAEDPAIAFMRSWAWAMRVYQDRFHPQPPAPGDPTV